MADSKNSKISQLDELVNPLDGDFLPIVDTAGQETKKISYSSLITALNADDDSYSTGQTDTLLAVNAAAIAAEESRATAAEVANATNISTNATDIATNATAISTETTRATTAEGVNATAIADEAVIRANADTVGLGLITANTTAITTEETRALAAEALLAPIDNATFTGTTTIPSADVTTADFNAGATGGELSWNGQEKTLNLVTGADTTIQVGQELVLYATNDSGVTIPNGSVVSIDGSQGNKPTIVLAQADTVANARRAIGVTTQSIPDNSSGFVTLNGKVRDLVLDGGTYGLGQVVYLSSTVAGGITNIQPDISVELGHVLATSTGGNTSGILEVQINNESAVHELEQDLLPLITNNTNAIAALPIAGSFMAPDHSYSTNSNALAAGFVENQLFLNTTTHNLSGVYSDNYTLLSQYSGASAAYSLRRLSSNTTSALKIRRTSDNEEVDVLFDSNDQVSLQSPVSPATFGTTLDEFANTEIVTYTSDFSAGIDGWFGFNTTPASQPDPVDAGNVLKVTVNTALSQHFVNGGPLNQGNTYSISAQVYVPSSNAILDGIAILDASGGMNTSYDNIATDQWVNIPTSGTAIGTALSIRGKSGTDLTFQGNGTDVFYVRNVVITDTTKDAKVVTWYDQSGNGNDATQTTANQQPKIVEGGVLVERTVNGVSSPSVKYTAGNLMTHGLTSLSADGQQSLFFVSDNQLTSSTSTRIIEIMSNTADEARRRRPLIYRGNGGNFRFSVDTLAGLYRISSQSNFVSLYSSITEESGGGTHTAYQDGSQFGSASVTLDANPNIDLNSRRLGNIASDELGAFFFTEVIYYPSDQSANRVAIEANINNHYFPITGDLFLRA